MRVLVAGLGSIGRRHARLLDARDGIDLVAYRTGNGPGTPVELDVETYDGIDAALATSPDVAFVTNPTNKHVETALYCARRGCDLFIEKPLSHERAGTADLIEVAERRDLVTMVGCQFRFDPVLQRVRKILKANTYGPVQSFRSYSGSYLPDWRPGRDYRTTYSAHTDRGGGVVLDLIHELDYLCWLFGSPDRVSSALTSVPGLEIDSEAVAEILMTVAGGTPGSIHLDYCRPVPKRSLELNCEDAVVQADLLDGSVHVETPEGTEHEEYDVDRDDRFRAQLDYFLKHVREREACHNDLRTAKNVLDVALEIKAGTPYE